ncbi:hypothetical protein HNR44_003053 [Geomicrobium halophilum]|uniref:Uncharacterized protein n=1 Tax=Geomicrobium halophilum TaxID=549000 RepID=A0A841PQN3_9BACL|nr:hypothetical protein [Geomicrobium halophilum]MBB6451059.1 hypothetical protein [Geomicrobium halophilum]
MDEREMNRKGTADHEIRIHKKETNGCAQWVDPEFFEILNEGMEEYHDTLKGLKDR